MGRYPRKILAIFRFIDDGVTAQDRQRIIRGTIYSFLIQGVSILLVFVSNLWMVKSSSPEAYGLYVHVFNWVSVLSVIVLSGRDDLVLALIPKYIEGAYHSRLIRLVKVSNRWVFFTAIGICGLFLGTISILSLKTLSGHEQIFLIASASVYFTACLGLNQMILQALNHIRLSQLVERIAKPLLLITLIGLFRLFVFSFNERLLIILSSIVLGICCLIVLYLVNGKLKNYRSFKVNEQAEGRFSGKVFYFFSINLLYLLSTKITMLVLPYFTPQKDIGIFNISYRFADLLIFPFFLMHSVLPQLFARHSPAEAAYTQSLFSESNKLMSLIGIPLLLVNVFAGKFFLQWFGGDFTAGYTALVYISVAQFLFSFFGPANTILMMQDNEKYSASCLLLYVIVLLISSLLLIPAWGITGGALAILISSFLYNVLLVIVTYRLSGILSPFLTFLVRPFRRS